MLCLALMFSASGVKAQSSVQLNFSTIPSILSGVLNLLNSQYKFFGVRPGVDAVVSVVSSTGGAKIDILDDNAVAKPEGFSPKIIIPAHSTGMVTFKIEFKQAITGIPVNMDSVFATAIDIDGSSTVHEMDAIDLGAGGVALYQSTTPEISVTRSGTTYTGTNIGGVEYDGIDTSAKKVMFTVKNKNVGVFYYSAGGSNNTSSSVSRQKEVYFKDFVYPAATTLPVKYVSFDATVVDKAVMLKWVTSNETNNSHFEVERSFTSDFSTIGLVLDAETVNGNDKTYRFKDNSAALEGRSVVYYRLKQVDIDGKATYSTVLAVRLQAAANVVMQTAPNPFTAQLDVRFTATENGNAVVRIINANGQTIVSKQSTIAKGYNTVQVDGLARLAPGAYVAQLIMKGKVIDAQKVIKN